MPRGEKSAYTDKQKRKARKIEEGYERRGVGSREAARRAWATVNKESGGGNKSGSGRGVPDTHESSSKGGKVSQRRRTKADRSRAAKKAAKTRARKAHRATRKKTSAKKSSSSR